MPAQKVFLTKSWFDKWGANEEFHYYYFPNVIYYYNYEDAPNLGYWWIDNIEKNNLYVLPEIPEREGFEFTGWFLEPECENEWDGVLPISKDEKLTLYAGWLVITDEIK